MRRLLNTLYVTNPDAYVCKKDDAVCVRVEDEQLLSVPFQVLEGIVLFGHARCSSALMSASARSGVAVVLLDEKGSFSARVEGPVSGNILLRCSQYAMAFDDEASLAIAKRFVVAKVYNARVVVQRYARDYPESKEMLLPVVDSLLASRERACNAGGMDELRGVEGDAARSYFGAFDAMLRPRVEVRFGGRNRRPPKDPVNAALSFFYTLLAREVSTACSSVGLDPQQGYLHACRPGRMSLALDMMEELRSPLADRFVLSLFNRGQLNRGDFEYSGEACYFKDAAMKRVLEAWQNKKKEQVVHPFLKERVSIGLLPFLQAQLFSRYLRGDLDDYPAFLWR